MSGDGEVAKSQSRWNVLRDASVVAGVIAAIAAFGSQIASEDVRRCDIATSFLSSSNKDTAMIEFYREVSRSNC